jgi:hypothetical protein
MPNNIVAAMNAGGKPGDVPQFVPSKYLAANTTTKDYGSYPSFVNFTQENDQVVLMIRGPEVQREIPGTGLCPDTGPFAEHRMATAEFEAMLVEALDKLRNG